MFVLAEPKLSDSDTFSPQPFSDTFSKIKPLYNLEKANRAVDNYENGFFGGLRSPLPVSIVLWLSIILGVKFIF
jgi:hypothetical protein